MWKYILIIAHIYMHILDAKCNATLSFLIIFVKEKIKECVCLFIGVCVCVCVCVRARARTCVSATKTQ